MLDTALFLSGWEGAIMTHPLVVLSADESAELR